MLVIPVLWRVDAVLLEEFLDPAGRRRVTAVQLPRLVDLLGVERGGAGRDGWDVGPATAADRASAGR